MSTSATTADILERLHGTTRFEKGKALFESGAVRRCRIINIDGTNWTLWKVKSNSRKDYEYEVMNRGDFYECNCRDFQMRKIICMHVFGCICAEVLVK